MYACGLQQYFGLAAGAQHHMVGRQGLLAHFHAAHGLPLQPQLGHRVLKQKHHACVLAMLLRLLGKQAAIACFIVVQAQSTAEFLGVYALFKLLAMLWRQQVVGNAIFMQKIGVILTLLPISRRTKHLQSTGL